MTKAKGKNDGDKQQAARSPDVKKPSFPKSMTIRYSKSEEKAINKLMLRLDEKTMSKTFLKCPLVIEQQAQRIAAMSHIIDQQREEISELKTIVASWKQFDDRLHAFLNKRAVERQTRGEVYAENYI